MTFDDVKPGFYRYWLMGRQRSDCWEIDVYEVDGKWLWGKGDDSGNYLTEAMLPLMDWHRPFTGKPEAIIPAGYDVTPEEYARWMKELEAMDAKEPPEA
jgi:hypothetical protein